MTVDAAVAEFRDRLNLERRLRPFEALRYRVSDAGTRAIHLDDFAAIPFLDGVSGVEHYQHRARLRARGGDFYVASTPASAGYERYCREVLGLGAVELLAVDPVGDRLAIARACLENHALLDRLRTLARRDGLVVEPFLGTEAIWDLAAAVAAATAARVRVLAPPPPVTWIANDKANFEDLVTAVLGPGFLPESRRSASAEALARALLELSEAGPSVALKRLRCASAMGNEVFESSAIRHHGFPGVLEIVRGFLERTGWEGDEDVLAVCWEPATSSPSTQWWLPPFGGGEPILGGVYEQILAGEEGVFVGSRPSGLAVEVEERVVSQSGQVAVALQRLGYVGRCSFDHLVLPDGRVVFTECNGRWGGTSTPMNLVDRLYPGGRPPYRAQAFVHPELVGTTFRQLLARFGDTVRDRGSEAGRYLLYNVGPLEEFGKFDVVALGSSRSHVEELMTRELPRRLGLGA
ncbi:MAG: hypothetical protein F4112_02400 [Holophagales bacterium]|nr:hypothetical protein [Holophagales bacterium]MYD21529.1 hypothetical protein [Holophagales bacterium]MYI31803.1 hypothetical protein [Holophagales bacterium]